MARQSSHSDKNSSTSVPSSSTSGQPIPALSPTTHQVSFTRDSADGVPQEISAPLAEKLPDARDGRSPTLPDLTQAAPPIFEPIGPIPSDVATSSSHSSPTEHPRDAITELQALLEQKDTIAELQELLKKPLESAILTDSTGLASELDPELDPELGPELDPERESDLSDDQLSHPLASPDGSMPDSFSSDGFSSDGSSPDSSYNGQGSMWVGTTPESAIAKPSTLDSHALDPLDSSHSLEPSDARVGDAVDLTPAQLPDGEIGVPTRRKRRKRRTSGRFSISWSILWVFVTVCFSGVGVYAFRWMTSLPPTPDCQDLSPLAADLDRLHCAHMAAESGNIDDLLAGFDLVRPWTSEHPLFWKAQSMMERWTKDVLGVAEATLYSQGLDEAVALVEAVPATSPLFDQAQGKLEEWHGIWSQGESIVQVALDAVQSDQWDVAAQQVVELGKIEHDYWRQERANQLSLRVLAERQGQDIYSEVKALAERDDPDELATAIAKLQDLEPNTFVWTAAQNDLGQWVKRIADTSLQRFSDGDVEGALALVKALPAQPDLLPGAADLVRFGYAQRQATDDSENWSPGMTPVVGFLTALSAAEEIPADSPFYDQAQVQMVQWRRELRDLTQLQLAQAIASTGHRRLFDIAVEQAKMVPKGQPRRLQAQTLIAHWRQEVERVEDRSGLALARRLAAPGTIAALQEAIAQAQQVPNDRALNQEADSAITQWTHQIQTIEDQPILDSAVALASGGDLSNAITEASKIESDRALYAAAQEQIGQWRTQILISQHQALLARARSLAGQTRLTEAINVASGISSATPAIYREARAAMAEWRSQRDRIWAARRPAPSPSPRVVRRSPAPAPRRASPSPSPSPSGGLDGYYGNSGN